MIIQTVVYPARLRKLFIRPRSGKSWSHKSYLSDPGGRKVGLRKVVYPAWIGERLFIRPGLEKKCLSGLAWRKIDLRSCLSGLGRREIVYPT